MQPLLLWKSNKYYVFRLCTCNLSYSARSARAPYCLLWPVGLYKVFPHFLINGTISEEKNLLSVNVFFFKPFSETFLFLIRIKRGMIINIYWSSCKILLSDFNET